jgi:hypothetical protein
MRGQNNTDVRALHYHTASCLTTHYEAANCNADKNKFDKLKMLLPQEKLKKVNFPLEQATKAKRGSRGTVLLFL